ncbi:hypothetical protein AX16_000652 [Volvariella volvacea WC 439]|nr:hypothetical protein AX16_000652 [Volvariella volvacea WC 439]
MAHSPSHRPTHSLTADNLQLSSSPTTKQQRRMTSPIPPPASLNLPEGPGWHQHAPRPPSPLRNGFTADTSTGIDPNHAHEEDDDEDDDDDVDSNSDPAWKRSPSPTSSVTQLAASLAQRVNSFMAPRSPLPPSTPASLPTDAELEAEAEREREKSRREAERIMNREAQERERKLLEARVLEMMENTKALPPPPSKSPVSHGPPSPAGSAQSNSSTSWWTAAKNKLIQSKDKEPLTPAQQVMMEAKAKEKLEKKTNKGKEREQTWPANSQIKFNDPAYLNLNIPNTTPGPPVRKPVPASPTSPTPSRTNMAPNLTPSPLRSMGGASPSREARPLYAQFDSQGTLDVPGTLLTIVKRFEKLEKWTVGHVRALEERMGDVERWLVDKEKEKEKEKAEKDVERGRTMERHNDAVDVSSVEAEVREMREEVTELSGRVSELGREVAKLVVSPSNLSNGPNRQSAQISMAPQTTSSIVIHGNTAQQGSTTSPVSSRVLPSTARDAIVTPLAASKASGTRLPYPTGDYTSPEMGYYPQGAFSPTSSPTSSLTSATRKRPVSISGLPSSSGVTGLGYAAGRAASNSITSPTFTANLGLPRSASPPPPLQLTQSSSSTSASSTNSGSGRAISPSNLPAPTPTGHGSRQSSVSPTPRKRYTVALGGPISAPDGEGIKRASTPIAKMSTAYFSSTSLDDNSDRGSLDGGKDDVFSSSAGDIGGSIGRDEDDEFQDETIGKSSSAKYASAAAIASASGATAVLGSSGMSTSPAMGSSTTMPGSFSVGDYKSPVDTFGPTSTASSSNSPSRKQRAQTVYGYSSLTQQSSSTNLPSYASFNTTAPLRPRVRSKSSDRDNMNGSNGGITPPMTAAPGGATNNNGSNKFVDPLLLRKQDRERERTQIAMPRPMGKVPIGQLVAFFDGEKK